MYRSTFVFTLAALATLGFAEKHHTTKAHTKKHPCTKTACVDYINGCGQTYGGCFEACKGYTTPVFTDPGCPVSTTTLGITVTTTPPTITMTTKNCAYVCSDEFDDCGNTFGPGCWTSCPGKPIPTYTTPYCSVDATAIAAV